MSCEADRPVEPRFSTYPDSGYYHCHWEEDPPEDPGDPPILTRSSGRYYCHWVPEYGGWDPAGPDDPPIEGGTYHAAPPSVEDDPHHALRGSLWYDDVYGPATQFVPDCQDLSQREHHPAEATWCILGEPPDSSYQAILQAAAVNVLARCSDLTTARNRVKDGIRLWDHGGEDYGGATRPGESWMLLSYGWVDADAELVVAHELIHQLQKFHRKKDHTKDFIAKEKLCSGGRSVFP